MKKLIVGLLFLGVATSYSRTWDSDGSRDNIQSIHDNNAQNGDTITVPAGTFTWTRPLTFTKGITLSGQTTISNPGTHPCSIDPTTPCASFNDQSIIVDELPRPASYLFRCTVPNSNPLM